MGRTAWIRRMTTGATVVTMATFGLTTIASAQTITNTGPDSVNRIDSKVRNKCTVNNRNNVVVHNSNYQRASTGNATESDNTTAGASWGNWASLDPSAAQASGVSYNSWHNGVIGWVGAHSSGAGWSGNQDNLTWAPSDASWSSYDPMTWQANGQSFGNWWNGVQSFLNGNSSNWLLGWPSSATSSGSFGGATSGNASNNNNSSFGISINNSARARAGTNACGQSNFTPPPASGGGSSSVGSQGSNSSPSSLVATQAGLPSGGKGGGVGSNSGGSGAGFSSGSTPRLASAGNSMHHPSSVGSSPSAPGSSSSPQPPSGGKGGGSNAPSSASISNTGPSSKNTVSSTQTNKISVANTNNVSVCNTSSQNASSGNASVSGNTSAGSGSSGYSGNGNGTGMGADLTN